jgi:hypothetical protein
METSMSTEPAAGSSAPVAFMSYAHHDDSDHRLATFRERLVLELRSQTGRDIAIFKDDDIDLGEQWLRRLREGLAASTFLLPIITPSFFTSAYCRKELDVFLEHERAHGHDELVLPILYIDCEEFLAATADEQTAALAEIVFARQYFDWRDLRLRTPSHAQVVRRRALLAGQIRKAMARAAKVAEQPAVVQEPAAMPEEPAPAQLERSQARPALTLASAEQLLDALCAADPVTSRPAAREAARYGPVVVPAVVGRLMGLPPPAIHVVRELLAQFPEVSAPLMVERLKMADQHWHSATQVPYCLSPSHRDACEDELAALLRSGRIDVVRKAIEGLGYVGAVDHAFTIATFLEHHAGDKDDYYYAKYCSYCVEALARIVTLTPREMSFADRVGTAFGPLEDSVMLVGARRWPSVAYQDVQRTLRDCGPHHGDRFVTDWLTSETEDFRDLGAHALGGIGLRRAVPALMQRAADDGESARVRRSAMLAAGNIGGAAAVEALAELAVPSALAAAADSALAMCAGDARDDVRFRELVARLIAGSPSEIGALYRAAGVRRDDTLIEWVRAGLDDAETAVRGDAALALARIGGTSERDRLLLAHAEASGSRERVLTSLALLTIGVAIPDDPDLHALRAVLAAESLLYRSETQRDVLGTLRASAHPGAAQIADAWEPIYAASSAY